jgi:hypothetical protein
MKKPIIGFGIAVVTLAGLAFIAQNLFVNDQKTAPFTAMNTQNNGQSIAPTLGTTQIPAGYYRTPCP